MILIIKIKENINQQRNENIWKSNKFYLHKNKVGIGIVDKLC